MAQRSACAPLSLEQGVLARASRVRRGLPAGALCAAVLSLLGCAAPAAPEVAQGDASSNASYRGWRVFQQQCARCHGPAATGTAQAPDLRPVVHKLDARRFVDLLLTRYEWTVAPAQPGRPDAGRDAWIDDVVQRRQGAIALPARGGEPGLTAYIADLYAYLAVRADGTQGPGRPAP